MEDQPEVADQDSTNEIMFRLMSKHGEMSDEEVSRFQALLYQATNENKHILTAEELEKLVMHVKNLTNN